MEWEKRDGFWKMFSLNAFFCSHTKVKNKTIDSSGHRLRLADCVQSFNKVTSVLTNTCEQSVSKLYFYVSLMGETLILLITIFFQKHINNQLDPFEFLFYL